MLFETPEISHKKSQSYHSSDDVSRCAAFLLFFFNVVKKGYVKMVCICWERNEIFFLSSTSPVKVKSLNHVGEVKLGRVNGWFLSHFEVHGANPKIDT